MRTILAVLAVVGACASPMDPTPAKPTATAVAYCRSVGGLPDARCTPGVVDPRVTQANVATTICQPGYTRTVRPPASYTDRLKREQMAAYGLTGPPSEFEEDHLIPLAAGGNPTDPKNLWPEPIAEAKKKDQVEDQAHRDICAGRVSLAEAQHRIATNWRTALALHV